MPAGSREAAGDAGEPWQRVSGPTTADSRPTAGRLGAVARDSATSGTRGDTLFGAAGAQDVAELAAETSEAVDGQGV